MKTVIRSGKLRARKHERGGMWIIEQLTQDFDNNEYWRWHSEIHQPGIGCTSGAYEILEAQAAEDEEGMTSDTDPFVYFGEFKAKRNRIGGWDVDKKNGSLYMGKPCWSAVCRNLTSSDHDVPAFYFCLEALAEASK